jgi:hypothetical protein
VIATLPETVAIAVQKTRCKQRRGCHLEVKLLGLLHDTNIARVVRVASTLLAADLGMGGWRELRC